MLLHGVIALKLDEMILVSLELEAADASQQVPQYIFPFAFMPPERLLAAPVPLLIVLVV